MSSKRDLKKFANKSLSDLAFKAMLIMRDGSSTQQDAANDMLVQIADFREDLLNRMQRNFFIPGPKETADHYRRLHDDLNFKLNEWNYRLKKMNNKTKN